MNFIPYIRHQQVLMGDKKLVNSGTIQLNNSVSWYGTMTLHFAASGNTAAWWR